VKQSDGFIMKPLSSAGRPEVHTSCSRIGKGWLGTSAKGNAVACQIAPHQSINHCPGIGCLHVHHHHRFAQPSQHVVTTEPREPGSARMPDAGAVLLHRRTDTKVLLRGVAQGYACRWYARDRGHAGLLHGYLRTVPGTYRATQWNENGRTYADNPEMVHPPDPFWRTE